MHFVDEAKIKIKAGDGGKGCISFRREKYVPRGGPDGGDGGQGGSVIAVVDEGLTTLMDFKYKKHFKAKNGEPGRGKNQHGKSAEDIRLIVPPGTVIYDHETNMILADLTEHGEEAVIAQGGRGGKGNAHFVTSTRQAPGFSQDGISGEEKEVRLELKMLADVGLVGMPNAGKSTFLSSVSAARPKVADYPFTTLTPKLGVVAQDTDHPYTIADIPGLIEGAHRGEGLGIQFLKHIERTKIFLHLVSLNPMEQMDPVERFDKILSELVSFDESFQEREMIVVLTQIDLVSDDEIKTIQDSFIKKGYKVFCISSVTKLGIDKLIQFLGDFVLTQEEKEYE